MQLMNIADHYVTVTRIEFGELTDLAKMVKKLITEIQLQQSEKLKEIE